MKQKKELNEKEIEEAYEMLDKKYRPIVRGDNFEIASENIRILRAIALFVSGLFAICPLLVLSEISDNVNEISSFGVMFILIIPIPLLMFCYYLNKKYSF